MREKGPEGSADFWMKILKDIPVLSREEEISLARKAKEGDRVAREMLIRSNLRLVVEIAKKYRNFGVPLEDLIQEGNIGLIKAVDRFDPEKGCRLSTYATPWIRQWISRALSSQSKIVRLPIHLQELKRRAEKISERLRAMVGREFTSEEIASAMRMPREKIDRILSAHEGYIISLDTAIGNHGDGDRKIPRSAEFIEERSELEPENLVYQDLLREKISEALLSLSKIEQEVVRMHFGLDGKEPLSLEEIGKKFSLTRERIRQIKAVALKKLGEAILYQYQEEGSKN